MSEIGGEAAPAVVEQRVLRRLPWSLPSLRSIHQRAGRADASAVLLLHGWPDSVLRFERVLPLLTDYHMVAPCLPGFPFAAPVAEGGMSADAMVEAVADTMAELGYRRYVVSAGDIGCDVAEALAARYPDRVAALHLTDVSQLHFLANTPDNLSDDEKAYVRSGNDWQAREGGYMHEQSTKPATLAVGLGDSPAGLAAWLLEKPRSWTDCGGDVESVFTRDELLTWITAYWVIGTIGTSFGPYTRGGSKPSSVPAPAVFTIFPRDLVNAPREFAERFFNVRVWREEPRGGHFAAWEQPDAYAAGVHSAVHHAEH
jgi:pimeloyl-ACP methyl ester carboxylesterase